jgi:Ion transport protein
MGFVAFQKVGDQSFFSDVGESIWSLMQLLTTVNFPDVMVKQYDASRFSILFFFVFCGLGIFFLVSVQQQRAAYNSRCLQLTTGAVL